MDEYKDDERVKNLNPRDKQRFDKITDQRTKDTVLEIGEFLTEHRNKKQYISVADFKKYTPLYSKEQWQNLIKQKGRTAIADLSTEFYNKFDMYKEIYVVKSYQNTDDVIATLPAAAVTSPSIELTEEQEKSMFLDKAKRKAGNLLRPDLVAEGQSEYYNAMRESAKTDLAVKHFALERLKTQQAVKNLDAIRQKEIDRQVARLRGEVSTLEGKVKSLNDQILKISDDEELFE